MKRSIPPRTMGDLSRAQSRLKAWRSGIRLSSNLHVQLKPANDKNASAEPDRSSDRPALKTGLVKKPRNWRFQTKPLFKKIKGPLIDVFEEAEEVLVVIDLGGFTRGDVSLKMSSEKYSISAKRDDQEFLEEIPLTPDVDIEKCSEQFRNGVLEIVLPRKKKKSPQRREKHDMQPQRKKENDSHRGR